MPVTAKLSQAFYDRFGDAIVGELVDWFNQVDDTYRNNLRELNELNFARFDAKLEQRIAELRADFAMRLTQLDARLEQRIAELRADFETGFEALSSELRVGLAAVDAKLEKRLGEQSRWFVGVLFTIVAAAAALWFRR